MYSYKEPYFYHLYDRFHNFGGMTFAYKSLSTDGEELLFVGVSRCCPSDNFSRKEGRRVALEHLEMMYDEYNQSDKEFIYKQSPTNIHLYGFVITHRLFHEVYMDLPMLEKTMPVDSWKQMSELLEETPFVIDNIPNRVMRGVVISCHDYILDTLTDECWGKWIPEGHVQKILGENYNEIIKKC